MFSADTRIADALAARPELRQILPAFHPAFEKLNHPVLGKILPRLVNVADAARVAGVELELLLEVMNLPGAHTRAPSTPVPSTDPGVPPVSPAWLVDPVELDVRPLLAAGEEPFGAIMKAVRALPAGRPLTVIAPFEPAPLLRLLAKAGFLAWTETRADGVRTSFWKAGEVELGEAPMKLVRGERGATLDVRELEPPEPLRQVLLAVEDRANLPLTVLHHREPALLYPRLQERGLRWEVRSAADRVEIVIDAA